MLSTPRRAQLGLAAAVFVFCCSMSILTARSLGRTTSPAQAEPVVTLTGSDASTVLAMKRP